MSQDQLIVTKNTNEFSKVRQYTDTDTSGPILSYLNDTGTSGPILSHLNDTVTSGPILSYLKDTGTSGPILSYLNDTRTSGPILSYLNDSGTSGPILSYLNDTGTSGPILSYINPYSLPSTKCRDMTIGCSMCPWLSLALVVHLTSLFLIQRSYFNNQQYPAGSWLCSLLRVTGTWFV